MDRRSFIRFGGYAASGLWLGSSLGCTPVPTFTSPGNGTPFTLGVLSGIHSSTEAVIWTRLEPTLSPGAGNVAWEVAADPSMNRVVDAGTADVGPETDWTIKVLIGGLTPNTSYWFRFLVDGVASPVGRARSMPNRDDDLSSLRLAVGSCQNWGMGYYNAWAGIASEDVDAVVWLGDYIYESSGSSPLASVRQDPTSYAEDVDTYRAKYRLYRSDPNIQAAHAAHPLIPVWDDHEFRNNFTRHSVAEDPQRFEDAYRVWFEYMPVMPIDGSRIYRNHRWGKLANLSMLDTRQYRDKQANGFLANDDSPFLGSGEVVREARAPGRTILGTDQRRWLLESLSESQDDDVIWKVIGNQVMVSPLRIYDWDTELLRTLNPNVIEGDGLYLNFDDWKSYESERRELLNHLHGGSITGTSFLTGDIHSFWQSTLQTDFDDPTSPYVANEFVCGSISSIGVNVAGYEIGSMAEGAISQFEPRFRFSDHRNNGYGLVSITPEEMSVTYRVTSVSTPNQSTRTSVRFDMDPTDPIPVMSRPTKAVAG